MCAFVDTKTSICAAQELCNNGDMGTDSTWYEMQLAARCFVKDETYESHSPWKGHCFAQPPSAGTALGVQHQIDQTEMTLK